MHVTRCLNGCHEILNSRRGGVATMAVFYLSHKTCLKQYFGNFMKRIQTRKAFRRKTRISQLNWGKDLKDFVCFFFLLLFE